LAEKDRRRWEAALTISHRSNQHLIILEEKRSRKGTAGICGSGKDEGE